jgi:hypothetical protein
LESVDWSERPLRILDFIPPDPDRYETLELNEQFRIRKELGFNAEHVEVHDISLGEAGITFYPSEHAVQVRKNILGEISKSYQSLGIYPIVYFNVHWLAPSFCEKRPEWLQRSEDGRMIPSAYGAGGYSCINSPFREYTFSTLRTLAQFNIRGVFLDGPVFRIEGCYCNSCKQLFMRQYGYAMPLGRAMSLKERIDLFEFKKTSIARFMKECNEILKSVKPDSIIYMNSPQCVPTKYCSRDNRLTVPYQDMLLAEGGFLQGNLRESPIWKPAMTAMLLESQAQGKPYCVAIAGRLAPWSRYLLSAPETWISHAMAVAHGANTWYGIYNDNNRDPRMETVKQINQFLEKNEVYYTKTKSTARIALLWSYPTANYYQSSAEETDFTDSQYDLEDQKKADARLAFLGWFDALSRSRILFDVIDEVSLIDGSLAKYDLLILPNTSCMSEQEARSIRAFVQRGGKLISSFDTSLYDEFGRRRSAPLLADVMGICKIIDVSEFKYDHISVLPDEVLTKGIDQSLIPAAPLGLHVIPSAKADTVMCYREKQVSRYCELPAVTKQPYIIRQSYGRGYSIYFSGNIDQFYYSHALTEYRKLMSNAVHSLVPSRVHITMETELESLHISLRQQPRRLILHLINYTGSMTRPIAQVMPLRNLHVQISEVNNPVQKVHCLRLNQAVPFEQDGERISFTVPEVWEYEVVAIEWEG